MLPLYLVFLSCCILRTVPHKLLTSNFVSVEFLYRRVDVQQSLWCCVELDFNRGNF